MGTTYSVTVVHAPEGFDAKTAQQQVETTLTEVNAQMSTYQADSDLSRLNRGEADTWIPVSAELLGLLKKSSDISAQTGGAFDVTVGPLVNLWGFGPDKRINEPPEQQDITERMRLMGLDKLILRDTPPSVSKRQQAVYVDLSAIAKGHGVDVVAAVLSRLGADRFLVEIGGELFGKGLNAQDKPWQVAVERPIPGAREIEKVVNLQGQGMATSGGYRNYFEAGGKRYSHTIDPRTGRPVTHDLRAVTVLAPNTADADALATALLVMGPKEGLAFARREKIAALFISGGPDGYTDNMTQQFAARVSDLP